MQPKIVVIGRGTAGVVSALTLRNSNQPFEWYYDEKIPPVRVGEGSTLELPVLLAESLEMTLDELQKDVGGSPKHGILKEGWGTGENFTHWFPSGLYGIHFDSHKLHEWVLKRLPEVHECSINSQWNGSPDDVDADYIIDCRGTPNLNGGGYYGTEFQPVNRATVWQCKWDGPRFEKTITFARPHGWVFGIPLQGRCAIGYVHNSDLSSAEEISLDVEYVMERFGLEKPDESNEVDFNSYMKADLVEGRTYFNGNRAFFLEPLEANSTAIISKIASDTVDHIRNNDVQIDHQRTKETLSMIAFHYAAGSSWNTDFWEYAQESAIHYLAKNKGCPAFMQVQMQNEAYVKTGLVRGIGQEEAGTWSPFSWASHYNVLKFDETLAKVAQIQ